MPFLQADRVMETTTTTGTGTLTLAGAVTGFQTFAAVGNANTCAYAIFAVDGNGLPTGDWETGIGTYTASGTTLSRGVIESSNANALVSFAAGTKRVIVTSLAKYAPLAMATTANRAIQVADQVALGSVSGNARGAGAVDLQIKRNTATQVAGGPYATISGGQRNRCSGGSASLVGGFNNIASGGSSFVGGGSTNTASGGYAVVVGGENNVASGYRSSLVGGVSHTASATYATIGGGFGNTASGSSSTIAGGYRAVANKHGQQAHAAGRFSIDGDAQRSAFVLRITTTNEFATEMFLDGSSARMTLSNDTSWTFDGLIVARNTGSDSDVASYSINGSISRGVNAAATVLDASTVTTIYDASLLWVVTIEADTTNGALKISVTGEAAKTIKWVTYVRTAEVTG